MKTFVIATLQIEGIHCWPNARALEPVVGFLQDPHRHMFHIKVQAAVTHGDRDIEIIKLKRGIEEYLKANYWNNALLMCDFRSKSCEMIAADLLEAFKLDTCIVLEDGENGALVVK